jgi:hypothetical protein
MMAYDFLRTAGPLTRAAALAVALSLTGVVDASADETEAKALLKAMSDYLAAQEQCPLLALSGHCAWASEYLQ